MNIANRIYNAKVANVSVDKDARIVSVAINYDNEYSIGVAITHTNDKDFFSEKVGYRIALSRAKIAAFKRELRKARRKLKERKIFYKEVIPDEAMIDIFDPRGAFARRLVRDQYLINDLRDALKREEANLNNYIKGQDKMIESVKRFREKDKEKANNN